MKSLNEIDVIRDACDLTYIAELFRKSAALDPALYRFEVQAAELLRHKAGKRCLIKYSGLDANGSPLEYVGKIRFKGLDEKTPKLHSELREAGFDGTQGYCVPRIFGMVPALNMWLQEYITSEKPVAVGSSDFVNMQVQIAEALARLHRTAISSKKHHLLEDELALLDDRFKQLEQSHPELSPAMDRLQREIRTISAQFNRNGLMTTIHRDFYFDQVLVSPRQTVLIDFDLCCLGPPALDVGNYIGHLREYAVRFPEARLACQTAEVTFQRAYGNCQPQVNAMETELWANLTLARHIFLSTILPDRAGTTLALVEQATKGITGLRLL